MPPSRMAEYFKDRRWRIVTEATGAAFIPATEGPLETEEGPVIPVHFDRGRIRIDAPGAFRSPLSGNPGRSGFLLQEVDADGNDIPGSQYPFGEPAVKAAREDFHAIM